LLTIINDILDFSKVEAGKMEIETIDIDLGKVLHDIGQIMATKAREKNIEFICMIEENVPIFLKGDPTRLRQIIINLAGNAVKFVDKGEVLLKVSLVSESPRKVMLRFEVIDTGVGISREQSKRLFHSFSQVDDTDSCRTTLTQHLRSFGCTADHAQNHTRDVNADQTTSGRS